MKMFKNIKYFFKSLVSSNYGDVSSSRVTMLSTCAVILLVFIYKNITSAEFVDFPSGAVYVLLVTLGAKVMNSFSDNMVEKAGDLLEKDKNSAGT